MPLNSSRKAHRVPTLLRKAAYGCKPSRLSEEGCGRIGKCARSGRRVFTSNLFSRVDAALLAGTA